MKFPSTVHRIFFLLVFLVQQIFFIIEKKGLLYNLFTRKFFIEMFEKTSILKFLILLFFFEKKESQHSELSNGFALIGESIQIQPPNT